MVNDIKCVSCQTGSGINAYHGKMTTEGFMHNICIMNAGLEGKLPVILDDAPSHITELSGVSIRSLDQISVSKLPQGQENRSGSNSDNTPRTAEQNIKVQATRAATPAILKPQNNIRIEKNYRFVAPLVPPPAITPPQNNLRVVKNYRILAPLGQPRENSETRICPSIFKSRKSSVKTGKRLQDVSILKAPQPKRFKCHEPGCDYKSNRQGLVDRHMSVHTGKKSILCHICNRAFSRSDNCKQHIQFQHPKEYNLLLMSVGMSAAFPKY